MSDAAYHHGDLRRALLAAAGEALERGGYETLSLRELAAAAGVSHGAPYRHFTNREALLVALAVEGALILETRYRTALAGSDAARAKLRRVCEAYLGLAAERPQLFRLMFASEVIISDTPNADWSRAVEPAYYLYEGAVAAAFPSPDAGAVRVAAAACWATIHGLALLRMHGRLQRFTSRGHDEAVLIDAVLDRTLRPPS
jgi:AcrR family transcriptional regulator